MNIGKTKKSRIPTENLLRESALRAGFKCKIESRNGKNSLSATQTNSNVQSRNMQTGSASSIENRHNSNSKQAIGWTCRNNSRRVSYLHQSQS